MLNPVIQPTRQWPWVSNRASFPWREELHGVAGAIYPICWYPGSGVVPNILPFAAAGGLTGGNTLGWRNNLGGTGTFHDNDSGQSTILTVDSPDPGFWHDAFDEWTLLAHTTLLLDNFGPQELHTVGGNTNGIAIGYRTSPDTIIYSVSVSGDTDEIAGQTTYPINNSIAIAATYRMGAMRLFVNGQLAASAQHSTGGTLPAHSADPGFGSGGPNGSSIDASQAREWGGLIHIIGSLNTALSDQACLAFTRDPYSLLRQEDTFHFPVAAAGGITPFGYRPLLSLGVGA